MIPIWWSTGQERMNLAILEFIVKDKYNPPFDDQVPIRECCWQRKGKWNLATLLRGYLPWTCALMLKCIYIKNVRNCGNILKGLPMAKSHRKNIFFLKCLHDWASTFEIDFQKSNFSALVQTQYSCMNMKIQQMSILRADLAHCTVPPTPPFELFQK